MTSLEHLIENTLVKFENNKYAGMTYDQILRDIQEDINCVDAGISAEECFEICQYVHFTYCDDEAHRKSIPIEPDFEGDGYDKNGNLVYDVWICPNCGKHFEMDYEEYDFCPHCGQAIKWEEEK